MPPLLLGLEPCSQKVLLTLQPARCNYCRFVVPGSHKDPRNPRSTLDGIDGRSPIPGELQITAPPGSVFIQDSRTWVPYCIRADSVFAVCLPIISAEADSRRAALLHRWHTAASNPSDQPRVAVVARFAPWWLTSEMGWGDGAQEWVPRPVYEQMGPALQKLVRHRTCGVKDELQAAEKWHDPWGAEEPPALDANVHIHVEIKPPQVRFGREEARLAELEPQSTEGLLRELSRVGYCLVENVVPERDLARMCAAVLRSEGDMDAAYGNEGDNAGRQFLSGGRPGTHTIAFCPELAEYIASERVLAVAKAALDSHLRVTQAETWGMTRQPHTVGPRAVSSGGPEPGGGRLPPLA